MPKTDLSFITDGYAPVASRITLFYESHPSGRIVTDLVSRDGGEIVFRARVYRLATDRNASATGWASERVGDGDINRVACLENTETSAVGRALANLGFTAAANRASQEEMLKVERTRHRRDSVRPIDLQLQHGAKVALDVLRLIDSAEATGLSPLRVAILKQHVNAASPMNASRLEAVERRLRSWIRSR